MYLGYCQTSMKERFCNKKNQNKKQQQQKKKNCKKRVKYNYKLNQRWLIGS